MLRPVKCRVLPGFIVEMKQLSKLKNMSQEVYQVYKARVILIPLIHNMCVIKAWTPRCVRIYSERTVNSHSPGGSHFTMLCLKREI